MMLMLAVPASVAGVEKVVVCTPPDKNGKVEPVSLVAAQMAGVTEVYKLGGVQALAAIALGTETIPKVDKLIGPVAFTERRLNAFYRALWMWDYPQALANPLF